MWIETSGPTKRLYDDEVMDAPVEFSDSGSAQVPADVGEALIDKYDDITETNS